MPAGSARYWDEKSGQVITFAHPLHLPWLEALPKTARILDYGCGYGRTLAELRDAGWRGGVGVDASAGMIGRGRREHPDLDLRVVGEIAEPDGAFDAALLFAVLTTIPDDAEQAAMMAALTRLLAPGGWLYLSDYPLQDDERSLARYRAGAARHGLYGVWDREDGAVFRHHSRERLDQLLAGFEVVAERQVQTVTFSGAPATAIQLLARKRSDQPA
jgi:SAM-dependent methyltransferase